MGTPNVPPVPTPPKAPVPMPPPPGNQQPGLQQKPTVDEEEGDDLGVERSFWQIPFVQDILPFITSLIIHLSFLALGLITAKTIQSVVYATREPVIIPDATIVEGGEIGGIPHPGLGGDETRDAAQDQFKDVPPDSQGISEKPSASLTQTITGGGGGEGDDGMIAVGASTGGFGRGSGLGSGTGPGVGAGTGDGGGPLAPFGIPGGGGGIGPKSPFMGVSGNAMKVVYLCDSSGSMMNKFDMLRVELRKAVDALRPVQQFDVIFFAEDNFLAMDKMLLNAVPEAKRKAYDFLEKVSPHGSSDPIPGLRQAFATGPQLIYMLTDGDFPNNTQVIEEIRKLNVGKKVKINTIAFMDRGEEYEKLLKTIASENGGLFKFVSGTDLGN